MNGLLKERLVHFFPLGAVLFLVGILRGADVGPSTNRIPLTPGVVERLIEGLFSPDNVRRRRTSSRGWSKTTAKRR